MKKTPHRLIRIFTVFITFSLPATAQPTTAENSLFWEVSGKGLKEPSYLFGTFHLLGSEYVDSLTQVKTTFNNSKTLVSEMVFDDGMTGKMMKAAIMKDTTLQDLLPEETYTQTSEWLMELTGLSLKMFNQYNPAMVQLMLVAMLQQKINRKAIVPMDLYFQNLARDSKKVVGLESFEDQVEVLFGNTSYAQQAKHLIKFVQEKDESQQSLITMNRLYREQDLTKLMQMFLDSSYSANEQSVLLDQRNKFWMMQLPDIFAEQSTFVAVGALHLPGENGLIQILRNMGYKVTPLKIH